MVEILNVANWLLPMLYLALLVDYGSAFFLRTKAHGRSLALPAVLLVHVLFLVVLAVNLRRLVPVSNYEVLSVLAAATAVVYCVVEFSTRERRTGAFVLLVVFLLQYTSSVFLPRIDFQAGASGVGSQVPAARFHILPALVAYTGFTISAIYGVLHLLARRDLKRHRFGLLFDRLPPLELLGRMNWHAMLMGFVFMTLSIVSGAVMYSKTGHAQGASPSWDLKILSKIIAGSAAWVIYAGAIAGKWIGKWESSRVSRVAVYGFLVVMVLLVASTVLS